MKNILINYRMNKAIKKWNEDIPYIQDCIEKHDNKFPPGGDGENYKPSRYFYWTQLIMQEIRMYIRLNKKINEDEFITLCDRRGFVLEEQNYLQSMMKYVGLMK